MKHFFACFVVTTLVVVTVRAQTPTPPTGPPIVFEAATLKPNDGSSPGQRILFQPGGRFTVNNIPLRGMITTAYGIQANQLVGAPAWVNNDRWDVLAKLPDNLPPVPAGAGPGGHGVTALRALLADRFKLRVHTETREMDIYHLVLARPDRRLGPELKQAGDDCTPEGQARRKALPPDQQTPFFCGIQNRGIGRLALMGMPMSFWANQLVGRVGRFVVDRTGLEGRWDFVLTFLPEQPIGAAGDAPAPADPNAPTLLTALQEQLGLKLEPAKGPVEVTVIDSVERPTPD